MMHPDLSQMLANDRDWDRRSNDGRPSPKGRANRTPGILARVATVLGMTAREPGGQPRTGSTVEIAIRMSPSSRH